MSAPLATARDLHSFMTRNGWIPAPAGADGTLWTRPGPIHDVPSVVGVPAEVVPGSFEWEAVIARLAGPLDLSNTDVEFRISHEHIDVTNLRAANDLLIRGSIPLASGLQLVTSARQMLRASATTAWGAKASISGGYSKDGDLVLANARMGHTNDGYIIPILMPIPDVQDVADDDQEPFEGMHRVPREPIERRTMRTFAQALTAVARQIVQPAVMPTSAQVAPLVAAGVSREFVVALQEIVEERSVSTFDAEFLWAGSTAEPKDVPAVVVIPREAGEFLGEAARHLKTTQKEPLQVLTGPIIEWHHKAEDPSG